MKISRDKIELAMARAQIDRDEMARKAGLLPASITNALSRGSCKPSTAGRLAAALGVDVTEILADE